MAKAETKSTLPFNRARDISPVEPYRRRLADMRRVGESYRKHWAEIEEYEFPRRGRWLRGDDDTDLESKVYSDRLLNNTPLSCRRTIASGLQNGLTPSSRDWYEIHPEDESLRDDSEVTWYLSRLKKRGIQLLSETNFYSEIYGLYEDTPAFGVSAMLMEDDDETLLTFTRLPVGSFWPEMNALNHIIGLARRYAMSVEALFEEFGEDAMPERVLERLRDGRYYEREAVYQFIRPVDPEDSEAPDWAGYECVYFLDKKPDGDDRFLARRYYRVRPFVVFRWTVDDSSPYGDRCPGMDALGDCRQLQTLEERKLRAIDISINPPLVASKNLRGQVNRMPGRITYVDNTDHFVKPLLSVQYDISAITAEIAGVQERIRRAHYEDIFLALLGTTKQMTAEEARQRSEERIMVLGPIIERFNYDLLEPVLNRLIDAIMFNQLAPPPPEALQGNIKFTYSGPLAQAQAAAKLEGVRSWYGLAAELAGIGKPEALDRIDADEVMEVSAQVLDVDEAMVVDVQEAQQSREAQAQAQEQQAQMQNMLTMSQGAKDLSQAQMGDGNLLEAAVGMEGQA